MCGIVAYISKDVISGNELISSSIHGILSRGYDSIGILRKYKSSPIISKSITNVQEFVSNLNKFKHNLMIAHTRWATHGTISLQNAHPHVDIQSLFSVVHNGIITNYNDLIHEYKLDSMKSDTDTEVIVQIMSKEYEKSDNIEDAFNTTIAKLQGTWAIVLVPLFINEHMLLIHCNDMPIVISQNKDVIAIASECSGLPFNHGKYARLEDNKPYIITTTTSLDQSLIYKHYTNASYVHEHEYHTINEIYEQSNLVRNLSLPDHMKSSEYDHLVMIGCGSSLYAANIASYDIRKTKEFQTVILLDGSNFDENDLPNTTNILVVFLSQSGETKELLNIAKQIKSSKWCIVNNEHSSLTSVCDKCYYMNLGKELGVASTKSVVGQILFLRHMFVNNLSDNLSVISKNISTQIYEANNVSLIKFPDTVFVLGNKERYGVAQEIALKFKELTYIHAEAFANNALRHGPFTLLNKTSLCIIIDDNNIDNIRNQILARECPMFCIPYHDDPLMQLIYAQILCYRIVISQKCHNPDYPRNIAKVVTVD